MGRRAMEERSHWMVWVRLVPRFNARFGTIPDSRNWWQRSSRMAYCGEMARSDPCHSIDIRKKRYLQHRDLLKGWHCI